MAKNDNTGCLLGILGIIFFPFMVLDELLKQTGNK